MWDLGKIPKTAHFYWGNDTMSFLRYLTIASFRKFNPDWRVIFYYPKIKFSGAKTWGTPEQSNRFTGIDYMGRLMSLNIEKVEVDFVNYGLNNEIPETFKADFLRWYLLSNTGGFWSDLDIIYFRPMAGLYFNNCMHRNTDAVICLNEAGPESFHSIGFLMASARNEFFKFINSESYRCLDLTRYQSIGSNILNLHFPTLSQIKNQFRTLNVVNIPMDVVYPLNGDYVPYIFHTGYLHYLTERTIGLHWYAGHSAAGEFENAINEHNFFHYSSILSNVIGRAI
jgi:hypothetical protein